MALTEKTKAWIQKNADVDLAGETVLITGTNSGIVQKADSFKGLLGFQNKLLIKLFELHGIAQLPQRYFIAHKRAGEGKVRVIRTISYNDIVRLKLRKKVLNQIVFVPSCKRGRQSCFSMKHQNGKPVQYCEILRRKVQNRQIRKVDFVTIGKAVYILTARPFFGKFDMFCTIKSFSVVIVCFSLAKNGMINNAG